MTTRKATARNTASKAVVKTSKVANPAAGRKVVRRVSQAGASTAIIRQATARVRAQRGDKAAFLYKRTLNRLDKATAQSPRARTAARNSARLTARKLSK